MGGVNELGGQPAPSPRQTVKIRMTWTPKRDAVKIQVYDELQPKENQPEPFYFNQNINILEITVPRGDVDHVEVYRSGA